MKKALIIIGSLLAVLALLVVGVGIWAYNEFLHTEPLTQAELAELTVDWDEATGGNWSPWYTRVDGTTEWNPVASYNDWVVSVPEEEKAWPALVEVFHDHYRSVFQADAYLEYAGTLPHHQERWARWRELLDTEAVTSLTAGLEKAVSRPVLGCELLNSTDPYEHAALIEHGFEDAQWEPNPPENQEMLEAQLPWLGRLRGVTNVLQGRAALALEKGNPDEFVRLIGAMERASNLNADLPILIGRLVEIAIDSRNHETIGWALAAHRDQLDETHLARLADVLDAQARMNFDWWGERLTFHDAVRRMADENGAISAEGFADGSVLYGEPVSLPLAKLDASARAMLLVHHRTLERGAELSELPWKEQLASAETVLETERDRLNFLADKVLDILIPAVDKAVGRVRMFRQQTIGMQTAVAAHRHRLRHGDFPTTIDAIDDDLLTFDPIDAFTGEPLKYRLTETGPLIYSVGDDRVDDGGMIRWRFENTDEGEQLRKRTWPDWHTFEEADRLLRKNPEAIRGDWILFPAPVGDSEPVEENEPNGADAEN